MELLKDPCYEIWPPIGDQVVSSQNIPGENSDDMISLVPSQNIPDENSDDMTSLFSRQNIPGKKSYDMKYHNMFVVPPVRTFLVKTPMPKMAF